MTTPPNAPPPAGGYGGPPAGGASNTPTILGIVGIVCWFCCSPAAIALGLYGQSKARETGQSDTLPRIAWIGGVVFLIIGVIFSIIRVSSGS